MFIPRLRIGYSFQFVCPHKCSLTDLEAKLDDTYTPYRLCINVISSILLYASLQQSTSSIFTLDGHAYKYNASERTWQIGKT